MFAFLAAVAGAVFIFVYYYGLRSTLSQLAYNVPHLNSLVTKFNLAVPIVLGVVVGIDLFVFIISFFVSGHSQKICCHSRRRSCCGTCFIVLLQILVVLTILASLEFCRDWTGVLSENLALRTACDGTTSYGTVCIPLSAFGGNDVSCSNEAEFCGLIIARQPTKAIILGFATLVVLAQAFILSCLSSNFVRLRYGREGARDDSSDYKHRATVPVPQHVACWIATWSIVSDYCDSISFLFVILIGFVPSLFLQK